MENRMSSERALQILSEKRDIAARLQNSERFTPEFKKWSRDTEVAIERIFGAQSRNIEDFKSIGFSLSFFTDSTPDSYFQEAYVRGLQEAHAVLSSMIDEIIEYSPDDVGETGAIDYMSLIERICLRFNLVARQLRSRHAGRETLSVDDEYDVQDLLHALLRLHFDDVRPEEWTPSYAGRSSRVDFLLKKEKIVIEVKKTRAGLSDGKVGEELIIDRARYSSHPDCKTLVCFVYDPEGRIGNPVGVERDLENHDGQLNVRVVIAPRH